MICELHYCVDCGKLLVQEPDESDKKFAHRKCCRNMDCRQRKIGKSLGLVNSGGGGAWAASVINKLKNPDKLPWKDGEIVFHDAKTNDGGVHKIVPTTVTFGSASSITLWENDPDAGI